MRSFVPFHGHWTPTAHEIGVKCLPVGSHKFRFTPLIPVLNARSTLPFMDVTNGRKRTKTETRPWDASFLVARWTQYTSKGNSENWVAQFEPPPGSKLYWLCNVVIIMSPNTNAGVVTQIRPRPLLSTLLKRIIYYSPTPAPAQSKVWVCGRSLAGIVGSNPTGCMDVCLLWILCVVLVVVSASGFSLVQRNPTEFGVSECDREASIMRRPWPTGAFSPRKFFFH
jgi:hypothetical protein